MSSSSKDPGPSPDVHSPVVLLVDDEELFRITLRAYLEAHLPDVAILEAEDGREAVSLLARSAVDCVVTDLAMSGIGGVGLLTEMLVQKLPIPVVVVSACACEAPTGDDAMVCFTKPVELSAVCDAVDELLQGSPRSRVTLAALVHVIACERRACALHLEGAGGSVADLTFEHGLLVDAVAHCRDGSAPISGMEGALAALDWKPERVTTTTRPPGRPSAAALAPLSLSHLFAQHRVRKATRAL